jgi:hypothetical protein
MTTLLIAKMKPLTSKKLSEPVLGSTPRRCESGCGWWLGALVATLSAFHALAAAPSFAHRWVLEMDGVPVTAVSIEQRGSTFRYVSENLFQRGRTHFEGRFELNSQGLDALGRAPETAWLAKSRAPGCQRAFDERDSVEETVCFESLGRGFIEKGVGDRRRRTPFFARYTDRGALTELKLLGVRYVASDRALVLPQRDERNAFVRGFKVQVSGSGVRLVPNQSSVRSVSVVARGSHAMASLQDCVAAAQAFRQLKPFAQLQLGVVIEGTMAYPHAWVQLDGQSFDPSVEPGDAVMAQRHYLVFDTPEAGRLYLQLLEGSVAIHVGKGPTPELAR